MKQSKPSTDRFPSSFRVIGLRGNPSLFRLGTPKLRVMAHPDFISKPLVILL
jgi:hypothetical protein